MNKILYDVYLGRPYKYKTCKLTSIQKKTLKKGGITVPTFLPLTYIGGLIHCIDKQGNIPNVIEVEEDWFTSFINFASDPLTMSLFQDLLKDIQNIENKRPFYRWIGKLVVPPGFIENRHNPKYFIKYTLPLIGEAAIAILQSKNE